MNLKIVHGDLLDQDADAIVNAWNRNFIPWWLLVPQGVSGAIKRKAGSQPFQELSKHGLLPLGGAVLTGAGRLPYKGIIHVAAINAWWRASEYSIQESVCNVLSLAEEQDFKPLALPLLGAGTGGFSAGQSLEIIKGQAAKSSYSGVIVVVILNKDA